jgi:uncharacterized protein
VRYWDSSAVLPLLVREASSAGAYELFEADPQVVTWWTTEVECASAIARREREGGAGARAALERLAALAGSWREVQPTRRVRLTARRLLRVHPLRAADALQLAAAIAAAEGAAESLPFVTLDARLADAAEREGFEVIRPA